jgi:NAD(P)-dependent dehydrogenase (short-subunit alcohol dehydrogenase family)
MKLSDRVALITGGGSGIGRATAELFAREGARVVVADLNGTAASQTVQQIRSDGGEAISIQVDVSKAKDVEEMVTYTLSSYGQVDILFNSAGIIGREAYLWEATEEDFDQIISVNLKGVFLACKYAIPAMIERRSGVVLNMSSLGGLVARRANSLYNASKAGVVLITRVLAKELAPYGIRANCIAPITTDTPLLGAWPEEARAASASRIPLGRIIQPEEIAAAALFLASDDSAMITGIPLVIDGGFTA